MNQNSLNIFKITAIVFIASFVIAIILFFIPKAGNLSNISYKDALIKAKEKNLPILVTSYSKWDKKQKLSNQILFTDKELVEKINKKLITVILDLDNDSDKKIIDELGLTAGFGLILDKNGKPMTFIPNSTSSTEFSIFLTESLNIQFFKWDTFEESLIKSKSNGKQVLVFSNSYINDNLKIAELLKDPINQNYLDMNFNPTLLYLNFKPDFEIGRQILGFDDKLVKNAEETFNLSAGVSNKGSSFSMMQTGEIKVSILDSNRKVIAQSTIDEEFAQDKNLQKFIEKILSKEEKRVE